METALSSPTAAQAERLRAISRVGVGTDNVDLAAWCASHKEELDGYFDKHGAILFRGFGLDSTKDFEAVASSIATGSRSGSGK